MNERFDFSSHVYVAMTVLLTVYGQLVLKWQIDQAGPMPDAASGKVMFLARQLANPWILSGFAAAFLASLAWMAAMTRLDLSYAYPFTSLAFILVMFLSVLFFGEVLTMQRLAGTALVILGLYVMTRSNS